MMPVKALSIVYVIDYLYSVNGGTERQLHQLIKGMVERGHSVRLFVFRDTDFTKNLKEFDCPVECLGIGSLGSISTVAKLWSFRRRLVRAQVDVVHGYFNDVALTLPLFFYGGGLQVFTSRRDMGIWYTPMKLFILRRLSRLPTNIICNCKAVAELTKKEEHTKSNRIHVIFNGIDPYPYSSDSQPVACDTNNDLNVVVVANVRPVKRIEDLIAAASILQGKNISYSVIGHLSDQKYYQTLMASIESAGLSSKFVFLGPLEEPREVLKNYQVGVISSESEGLSNTLIEYLDAGLVSVATNVGGNPEIITNGKDGFLYQKGSVDELVSILKAVEVYPEDHRHIIKNTKVTFQQFTVKRMVTKHEEVYFISGT